MNKKFFILFLLIACNRVQTHSVDQLNHDLINFTCKHNNKPCLLEKNLKYFYVIQENETNFLGATPSEENTVELSIYYAGESVLDNYLVCQCTNPSIFTQVGK